MPKINQEEYEILKSYISEEKYIAKDRDGSIRLLTDYPERDMKREEWSDDWGKSTLKNSANNFKFIQWEDEEPYDIAELIEEYESEETEVKDIEWLKETLEERIDTMAKFEDVSYSIGLKEAYQHTLLLINQLDEPEVLSQEWIDEHKESWQDLSVTGYSVPEKDLQNLLVPKQEREQKYCVDLDTAAYVAKWDGNDQVDIYTDGISGSDEFEFHLTEQEIKDYDERFWPFAVKVEELEE